MSCTRQIRILIVDDHPAVRQGLADMVSTQADMKVVATAGDGAEAVALFTQCRPDVTVMDMRMPNLNGLEAIRAIRQDTAHGRFIVMTGFQGDFGLAEAISAGAHGYLLKEMIGDELLRAIRAVHAGRDFFPEGARDT